MAAPYSKSIGVQPASAVRSLWDENDDPYDNVTSIPTWTVFHDGSRASEHYTTKDSCRYLQNRRQFHVLHVLLPLAVAGILILYIVILFFYYRRKVMRAEEHAPPPENMSSATTASSEEVVVRTSIRRTVKASRQELSQHSESEGDVSREVPFADSSNSDL